MTLAEITQSLAELAHARKAISRLAAERLAQAVRDDPSLRARVASLLSSAEPRERWGAAYTLAQLEEAPRDAIPALLDALASSDGDVRWASARLVVRAIRHRPELGETLRPLVRAASALQRKMALYCLRDLGGTPTVDATLIAAALADADAAVRLAAMSAAVAIFPHTAEAADLLAPLLGDVEPGVRRAAAATLGQLGVTTPAVHARLTCATTSGDAMLERTARQALSRLAGAAPVDR